MNKDNTVKIGDSFEEVSLEIIHKMIEQGDLGHLKECVKVFKKKEYDCKSRNGKITFDLAIEIWPPGATNYIILYLIECKKYRSRVPIGTLQKFSAQILEVAGHNVKAIFITNSPIQSGGMEYAKSKDMMVIQAETSDNYKILLHKRSPSSSEDGRLPFIISTQRAEIIDEGSALLEKLIDRQILSAFQQITDPDKVAYNIQKLSKSEIEGYANNVLKIIDTNIIDSAHTMEPKKLINYLEDQLKINIYSFTDSKELLGQCNIPEKKIGINKAVWESVRFFFVLAHEFAHYALHSRLSIGQTLYDLFQDPEYNFSTKKFDLKNPKHWIEWQANYFAVSLILPKNNLIVHLHKTQVDLNGKEGKLYVDDQPENAKYFNEVIKHVAYRFSTSKEAVINRLNELNYIENKSRTRHISDIIEEIRRESYI
jgi:Zn-dependent peptidase ImmA (M78 family)